MGEENKGANKLQEEKVLQAKSGFGMLVLGILLTAAGIAAFVWGCIVCDGKGAGPSGGYGYHRGNAGGVGSNCAAVRIKGVESKRSSGIGLVW